MQHTNFELSQESLEAYKAIKMKAAHRYLVFKIENQTKVAFD